MKIRNLHKVALGLLFFALLLLGAPGMAQSLKGSGELTTQSRSVSGIKGINVSGGFVVELTQGSNEGVRLEAQENLLDNIKTEVRGGILHIYNDKSISTSKSMKAFVTLQSLESVSISGGVKVIGNSSFKSPALKLEMSGGSNLKLSIHTEQIKGQLSGASRVELLGSAAEVNMQLSGASKLEASELEAQQVQVNASGASSVKVYAQKALDINASGASAVYYKGSPAITSDVTSAARVGKL